jgi:hypothetical protein
MGADPKPFDEKELHSFNRYRYASNNPYKFVDPNGAFDVFAQHIEIGDINRTEYRFRFYTPTEGLLGREIGRSFTNVDRPAKVVKLIFGQTATGVSDMETCEERKAADKLDPKLKEVFTKMFGDADASITSEDARKFLEKIHFEVPESRKMYDTEPLIEKATERRRASPADLMRQIP